MAKGALFISWGPLIPGREAVGAGVLQAAVQLLAGYREAGRIDGFDVYTLEPHRGDIQGFVILTGDKDTLASLRVDDAFVKTIVGVQLVHQKVGVVAAWTGAEMMALFGMWAEQEANLLGSDH
jgi:hypothetical protein